MSSSIVGGRGSGNDGLAVGVISSRQAGTHAKPLPEGTIFMDEITALKNRMYEGQTLPGWYPRVYGNYEVKKEDTRVRIIRKYPFVVEVEPIDSGKYSRKSWCIPYIDFFGRA